MGYFLSEVLFRARTQDAGADSVCRLAEILTESKGREMFTLRSVERQVSLELLMDFMIFLLSVVGLGITDNTLAGQSRPDRFQAAQGLGW